MSDFNSASQRIKAGLALVDGVIYDGKAGRIDAVFRKLQALQAVYKQAALPPESASWLTANSDRRIRHGDQFWSSSHEAALAIIQTVLYELYVYDLPKWHEPRNEQLLAERCRGFDFEPSLTAELQEGIRRESAKLLAAANVAVDPAANIEPRTKAKVKPGRKSNPIEDARIVIEYQEGLEEGRWKDGADYLRQQHAARWKKDAGNAKSWFTQLKKRHEKASTVK